MGVSKLFEKFVKRTKTNKADPKKPKKAFQTGLRDLFVPSSQDPLIDIVLIHDLTAGRDDSWNSEGSGSFWLAELRDGESRAHIAAFGYDVQECQVMDDIINHNRLKKFAEALLNACPLETSQTNNDRPIIFVAHGFGGLVYEMALTLAFERNRAQRRHAAVLLDTPHHGAGVAEWAIMCAKELGVPCANTAQEQDWSDWDESFEEIDATQKSFRCIIQEHMSIKIAGCFATKPIKETKLILSSEWAVLPEFRAFALGGTHLDMTKCRKDDAGCKMLLATLQRWSRDLTKSRIDHSDGAFDDDVVAQLENRNWRIKLKAIKELRHASGLSEELLRIVARLLGDDDLDVREAATVTLRYHSPSLVKSVTFVVDYLKYPYRNSQVVCGILNALKSQLDIPMEILQAIVEKLRTASTDLWDSDMILESAMIQESAINVLKAQPDLPTKILQKLVDWFMVKHEEDPKKAVQDVRTIEFPRKQMTLLHSQQRSLFLHGEPPGDRHFKAGRDIVLGVLNIFKCQTHLPKDIVRAMAVRLEDKPEDKNVTKAILGALEYRLDLLPKEIPLSIVARLKHEDFGIQQAAIKTFQRQSSLPEEVLQAIVARFEDQDSEIRGAAIESLRNQSSLPQKVLEAIMARLEVEEDNYVCREAIGVLEDQTILSKEVAKMVTRLEKFPSEIQPDILWIFKMRLDLPEDVIRDLKDLLNHKSLEVREKVASTLRQQPILPRDVLEAVIRQLEDRDEAKIRAAVDILGRGWTLDDELIDLIIDCSRDKYPSTRKAAVDVLGRQQALSPAAIDALKALVKDTDGNVGNAAIEVLMKHQISLA